MGSVSENYQCPWCRRTNGGYAPDWVGYPICTEGAFSCLWHHSLDNEHTGETVVALFENGWALHYVFVKKFDVGWCTRVWEFCAPVLGDVVRRLRLLRGVRAAMSRKGFSADLKDLATATADDFMTSAASSSAFQPTARPRESITTAVSDSLPDLESDTDSWTDVVQPVINP
jgi:hypothetical protein